jgi:hypothetical protein
VIVALALAGAIYEQIGERLDRPKGHAAMAAFV